jgi:hypothetical protein
MLTDEHRQGAKRIPARDYLGSVPLGLADLPMRRIPELTPVAWAASRK